MDPIRPSDAVSKRGHEGTLPSTCELRSTTASRLRRSLRGDLDTITLKALAKEPAGRYETVAALADDIRRHLDNQPIVAAPESVATSMRKFVLRNKSLVAGGACLAIVLVIATVVSASFAINEGRAREVAESINRFLNEDLLSSVSPSNTNNPDLTVREALDRAAERIEGRFDGNPQVEASIRHTIGKTYLKLGLATSAMPHLKRAATLYRGTLGELGTASRQATRDLIEALHWDDQNEEARALAHELLELDIRAVGSQSDDAMATRHLLLRTGGVQDEEEAERMLHTILNWYAASRGDADPETLSIMHTLANSYLFQNRLAEAEPIVERIWRAVSENYDESHPETLMAMLGRAVLYGKTDRVEEAVRILREAVRIHRETKPDNYADMGITLGHLGIHLEVLERYEEAEAAFLEGYQALRESMGPDIGWTQGIVQRLVWLYEKMGDEEQAAVWRDRLDPEFEYPSAPDATKGED